MEDERQARMQRRPSVIGERGDDDIGEDLAASSFPG